MLIIIPAIIIHTKNAATVFIVLMANRACSWYWRNNVVIASSSFPLCSPTAMASRKFGGKTIGLRKRLENGIALLDFPVDGLDFIGVSGVVRAGQAQLQGAAYFHARCKAALNDHASRASASVSKCFPYARYPHYRAVESAASKPHPGYGEIVIHTTAATKKTKAR